MTEDIYVFKEAKPIISHNPAPELKPETLAYVQPEELNIVQEEEVKTLQFNYLGENNRYFLVIIDDKTHPEINTPHKEMLMKVMGAKGLEMRDLAILNLAKYPGATFEQLKEFFSCNKIALFGIDPQRIALPAIPANDPQKHLGVSVLTSFSLDEMSSNVDKKKQFWSVMKNF